METFDYQAYFAFLRELTKTLEHLTEVEQKKALAVRQDDLAMLNECMKQEQAFSLTLRGYDQKRQAALAHLNLEGIPLSSLAAHVPEAYRMEAKEVSEELRRQYELLKGASEVAKTTLECNLHQIELTLAELGKGKEGGPGYQGFEPELPQPMRTDFRA